MSKQDVGSGDFMMGFILGCVGGAVAALLFAPQSGEETRTVIRRKGGEIKDSASQSANQAVGNARVRAGELAATAKERSSELRSAGEIAYSHAPVESTQ
jgi:gas vesicle protein